MKAGEAPKKEPARESAEVDKLCDDYLKHSAIFAKNLVKLAHLPGQQASDAEDLIVGQFSDLVSRARMFAVEQR